MLSQLALSLLLFLLLLLLVLCSAVDDEEDHRFGKPSSQTKFTFFTETQP
jgi:hypothetical protein